MADYVRIQHADRNDAATVATIAGHRNLADYVGYGLTINSPFDASPGTISISEGKAFILLETQYASGAQEDVHDCLATAHYEARDGIELSTSGTNYIWAVFNMDTNDSPHFGVTESSTAPTADSVLIGTVTPETESIEELNRDPDGEFESLIVDSVDIGDEITWPDGTTTDTHPITYGETLDNRNDYYDSRVDDPPGVVQEAVHASRADNADHAQEADTAALAENAEQLDGYSPDDILIAATEQTAREWTPLLDEPFEKESYDGALDFNFSTSDPYDRYRVRLQTESNIDYIAAVGIQVNGVTSNKYRKFNLTPQEYKNAPESYNEVQYVRDNHWTGGEAMPHSHGFQEFYIACPRPINGDGARRRNPLFNSGEHHAGTIRQHTLTGLLESDEDMVDQIRVFTDHGDWAARIQVYGQNSFPELE